ncbi:hypothetical protein LSAT2_011837 [Lamellibrachia satsuma]|nr:hypothetical protein LSAT2_011837 [Lamellibrachia satsuma]
MVYTKHCCYGTCNSDSRYADRPDMQGVFFINFPKPKTQREKCEKWIRRCGRPKEQFNVDRVKKMTFICSKHFVGRKGPTSDHPDPTPATTCPQEVSHKLK